MPTQNHDRGNGRPTFVMLTQLEARCAGGTERDVVQPLRSRCPEVRWIASYALSGPFDYLDVFEAAGVEEALRVASLVRQDGGASVQVLPASRWAQWKTLMPGLGEEGPALEMNGMGE